MEAETKHHDIILSLAITEPCYHVYACKHEQRDDRLYYICHPLKEALASRLHVQAKSCDYNCFSKGRRQPSHDRGHGPGHGPGRGAVVVVMSMAPSICQPRPTVSMRAHSSTESLNIGPSQPLLLCGCFFYASVTHHPPPSANASCPLPLLSLLQPI